MLSLQLSHAILNQYSVLLITSYENQKNVLNENTFIPFSNLFSIPFFCQQKSLLIRKKFIGDRWIPIVLVSEFHFFFEKCQTGRSRINCTVHSICIIASSILFTLENFTFFKRQYVLPDYILGKLSEYNLANYVFYTINLLFVRKKTTSPKLSFTLKLKQIQVSWHTQLNQLRIGMCF